MKLRTKFAIVLLLIAALLSAGVYGGLELYKQRLVGDAQQEVDETAVRAADQIEANLAERKDYVGFVASRPTAANFNESDRFLQEFVDNSRFFAAQVIANNGTIIHFHGDITQDIRQESIGRNVANRTYVKAGLRGEEYVTEPEYVNSTDKFLIVISAPIFQDRDIKGVLAAAMYIDKQTVFGLLGPLETSSQSVRVTSNDHVLYPAHQTFQDEIHGEAQVDIEGAATGATWTVTVRQDRSPLVTQLQDLAIAQGIGLFVVLLSVVGFGLWEYRTTLNQTEELLDGFRDLERGEFDTDLALAAGEEWSQISEGFNELADKLAGREEAIQQREQRLEVLNRALRHNLRNHTSVVLGYAETIRDQTTTPGNLEAAEKIIATAMELIQLSEKARQIEAAMDSESYGQIMAIEVCQLIELALEDLKIEYPEVEVTTSLPEEKWVKATPALELALENLFENSCEHNSKSDPELSVSITDLDGDSQERVRIEIADNGPGIPEQERRVIDQGQETALEHGSGLGLWLVYWTIAQSEGELRFLNTEPGTVVQIDLDGVSGEHRSPSAGLTVTNPSEPKSSQPGDPPSSDTPDPP